MEYGHIKAVLAKFHVQFRDLHKPIPKGIVKNNDAFLCNPKRKEFAILHCLFECFVSPYIHETMLTAISWKYPVFGRCPKEHTLNFQGSLAKVTKIMFDN